jgi:rhodanese-related sulfurtransferase/predicted methyltransferase
MMRTHETRLALAVALAAALAQNGVEALGGQSSNRAAQEARRETQQRVADIFKVMGVGPGAVVADVGAGQGFFTVRLAKAVGETGRVLAVDVSQQALRNLRSRVEEEGLRNVQVIEGATDDPHLPENTLDAALIVNAYHEMTEHQAMLARIRQALKPTGRLVIVEPISASRRDGTRDSQTRQHEIGLEFVLDDARAAGFRIATLEDPFSNHHGHGSEYLVALTPIRAATSPVQEEHAHEAVGDTSAADIRIAAADFAELHRSGNVIVLDVRDDASYRRGHIPQAKLAPMSALRDLIPELEKATVPIVAYCSCPAEETSSRAVLYLRNNGIRNARALVGGYEAWEAAGYRVDRVK